MSDEQKDLARALKLIEWLDAERKSDKALITELGRQLEVLSMQLREQVALLRQTQENLDQTTRQARKTLGLEESLKQARDHIGLLQQRMDQLETAATQRSRLHEVAEERQHRAHNELRQQVVALAEEFQAGRPGQFQEAKLEAARQSVVALEQRTAALEHDGEGLTSRVLVAEGDLTRLRDWVKSAEARMDEIDRDDRARQAQFKSFEERSQRSTEAATITQNLAEEIREQHKAILARAKLVEEQGRRAEAREGRIETLEAWRLQQQELWARWEERGLDWTSQIIALQEQMADRRRHDEKQDQQWRQFMDQYKVYRDEVAQSLEHERDDRRKQDAETLVQIDMWRAQVREEFDETRRQFDERVEHEHRLWTNWLRFEMEDQNLQIARSQDFVARAKSLVRGVLIEENSEGSEETT